MPRRAKVVKRELLPDARYQSVLVTRMVNKIMQRGKKGLAERIMYGALEIVNTRTGRDALDVLEHTVDDRAVVEGFHRLLRPDGVAVVTVPASMALWSDWDVALHHHRRYDRAQLVALFPPAQWEVLHVNYTNVFAFPAVWLVRKLRMRKRAVSTVPRAEDKLPPTWLNAFLRWLFVRPAFWPVRFPFGVSLLLVARKR